MRKAANLHVWEVACYSTNSLYKVCYNWNALKSILKVRPTQNSIIYVIFSQEVCLLHYITLNTPEKEKESKRKLEKRCQ